MDLNTVEAVRIPTCRDEVWPLRPGDAILAGGTWLFSEPQPAVSQLIDITALGWPSITLTDEGLELAATCTIDEIAALSTRLPASRPDWSAAALFGQCCDALLASFKVRGSATVGGNICLAFPAGAMISLCSALDATVTVWRGDGSEYRLPITDFVTGQATTLLGPGDLLRAVHLPAAALRSRTALRKLAPSRLGRSSAVLIGRRNDHEFVVCVTAATVRPFMFRFPELPSAQEVEVRISELPMQAWTSDAHGDPDWRRAVTLVLAEQVRQELS
ncbi:xanthine dehydrogenase family protein subunit M [Mycobacterium sp. SMC-4]|uniref:FAD binding domain-containing protein n=1 Tax=Mycobacterium sp. SMC-4 TaxID=2857059 RepID=UPI0021B30E61|nr:FAD binding domain-containing protein [Mycobacterium sp. SMC-4]UXA17549.1 FAD binding domain-containing protein [Mycobacterium sp. SMC-4]